MKWLSPFNILKPITFIYLCEYNSFFNPLLFIFYLPPPYHGSLQFKKTEIIGRYMVYYTDVNYIDLMGYTVI